MDITKLSEVELKALAYDEMAKLEVAQNNIRTINQELAKRANKAPVVEQKEASESEIDDLGPETVEPATDADQG